MKKKVNLNRPEISSEEIAQRKNFDAVLKGQAGGSSAVKGLLKKPWFLSGVVAVIVAVVVTAVVLNNQPSNPAVTTVVNDPADTIVSEEFLTAERKSCIAPPLTGLNIPYTTYNVVAEKGGTL